MSKTEQITPPTLERYELKFIIPAAMIDPISNFVSIYCSLDKYSALSENSFYRVNNLYFDTPEYLFLRNRINRVEKRFNMRVRSYGNNPKLPYFLEIKQKRGDVIKKYRGRVYETNWHQSLYQPEDLSDQKKPIREEYNLHLFQRLALIYNAEPKVLTQYIRKAYVSDCEEYARVTFDMDLRYKQEENYNLIPDLNQMHPYDFSTNFSPGCNVILELKCYTSHVPIWMIDCIKTFDLQRQGFSKYATGILEVLNTFNFDFKKSQSTILF